MSMASFFCNPGTQVFNADGRVPLGFTLPILESAPFTIRVPGKYRVVAIGGGGGCHFGNGGIFRYSCGAAGGLAIAVRQFSAGDVLNISVGAGGVISTLAPPPGGSTYALSGGLTSVNGPGISLTANGGGGGVAVDSAAPLGTYPGGVGGTATGGDFNYAGGSSGDVVKSNNDTSGATATAIAGPGAVANPFIVAPGGSGAKGGNATETTIGGPASLYLPGLSNQTPGAEALVARTFRPHPLLVYDYAGGIDIAAAVEHIAESRQTLTAFGESFASTENFVGSEFTTYRIVGGARVAGQPFFARHNTNAAKHLLNTYGSGAVCYRFTLPLPLDINSVSAGSGVVFLTYLGD